MAGAGYKLFNTGDVLTAAQVNTYLQEQSVMVFANAAARTSALSSVLAEGMITYLKDTDAVEKYNGTAWIAMQPGDIEGVTATSPLTGGGTAGTVTIGIQDGTTAQKGAVQLTDSIASTSTTTAATPNAVKTTYDLANTNGTKSRQYAATTSVLGQISGGLLPAENILKQGVFWIDAAHSSSSGQTITNLGWGGSALNATAGSTGSPDSNDPLYLSWTGTNYVYLPGVSGNTISIPDAANLDTTDLDFRMRISLDSPTTTGNYASRLVSDPNRSWLFAYTGGTTGARMNLTWYPTGSAASGINVGGTATYENSYTAGQNHWVRVTLDVDNGAGGYEVKFFTAPDSITVPTAWTQVGTTITGGTTTNLPLIVAGMGISQSTAFLGNVYRAQLMDSINGNTIVDIDTSILNDGNVTSFNALTGQTVTINSATSGRKTTIVTNPLWLLGTDDYFEVADNSYIDFTGTESFSLVAVMRSLATAGTNDAIIAKKADTTNTTQGFSLTNGASTALAPAFQVGDGSVGATAVGGSRTNGATTVVAAVRNVGSDNLLVYVNGTAGSAVTDATTTTSANSEVMRIGRLSGAGTEYNDTQIMAAAVFRRVLSADEISTITNYYLGRYGA